MPFSYSHRKDIAERLGVLPVSEVKRNTLIDEIERIAISTKLERSKGVTRHLIYAHMKEENLYKAYYFNPLTAFVAILALMRGVEGADVITVSHAVLAMVLVIKESTTELTPTQCAIFWCVCRHHGGATKLTIREDYERLCEHREALAKTEFDTALRALIDLGCIKEQNGRVKVNQTILFSRIPFGSH